MLRILSEYRPAAPPNTSLHVETRITGGINLQSNVAKICAAWVFFEDAIDLLVPQARRGNTNDHYSSNRTRARQDLSTGNNERVLYCAVLATPTWNDLQRIFGSGTYKANIKHVSGPFFNGEQEALVFEVRQHTSTYETEKSTAWIQLIVRFVASTLNQEPLTSVPNFFETIQTPQQKLNYIFFHMVKGDGLLDFYQERVAKLWNDKSLWCPTEPSFTSTEPISPAQSTSGDDVMLVDLTIPELSEIAPAADNDSWKRHPETVVQDQSVVHIAHNWPITNERENDFDRVLNPSKRPQDQSTDTSTTNLAVAICERQQEPPRYEQDQYTYTNTANLDERQQEPQRHQQDQYTDTNTANLVVASRERQQGPQRHEQDQYTDTYTANLVVAIRERQQKPQRHEQDQYTDTNTANIVVAIRERQQEPPAYYFAFGSNMSYHQMMSRNAPFRDRQPAALPKFSLRFNKRSIDGTQAYANVWPDESDENFVYGILYTGCTENTFLALDRFEGVRNGHYTRQTVKVVVPVVNGSPVSSTSSNGADTQTSRLQSWKEYGCNMRDVLEVDAVTYIAGANWIDESLKPRTSYLKKLLEGKDFLPRDYHRRLEQCARELVDL
ncbi:hypothetical protein BC938DRAFT_478548 [Jimgerdemannia flammicorona]|uniref:gamma-glutamylcyclotransferase n=1 Tax=Jimgerdemannia flammicorona TaxID=994334 RepID=A0A433QMQ7_9FUNG|nr:hypothetical protein BC938DRAFT_478548 [Jimgerdemannia flammicorona]